MTTTYRILPDTLEIFVTTVLTRAGLTPADAADAAAVLVWANRCGVDTHGVRNLKEFYVDRVADLQADHNPQKITGGRIRRHPQFRIEHETPFSARVDGDDGLGLVAACWGMRQAIAKANRSGVGLISMRNSHHFGAAGHHALMAVPHDMIGISLTGFMFAQGIDHGVLPTFGAKGMLSTNPISVAFPTGSEPTFLLDMATSVTPMNRVTMMARAGQSIPEGWGLDARGQPTTDPAALRYLLPLGGDREHGGHKGYGLALVVEVLCALLSGGWFEQAAAAIKPPGGYAQERDAHFFGAIRVDAFRPVDEFKRAMDAMIQAIRAAAPAPGHDRVYYPGEIEFLTAQMRQQEGIPLPPHVLADLQALAARYAVELDYWEAD